MKTKMRILEVCYGGLPLMGHFKDMAKGLEGAPAQYHGVERPTINPTDDDVARMFFGIEGYSNMLRDRVISAEKELRTLGQAMLCFTGWMQGHWVS